jgi:hypothetical protein
MTMSLKAHIGIRAILAAALLTFAANASMGQAGRHLPKRVEAPPAPTPTPEPTPQARPPAKVQFSLKVVSEIYLTVNMIFPFPEKMQTWTVDRLKRSPILDVTAGPPANRHDAVQLARAETEALIVWLQLEDTPLGRPENVGRRPASGEVWINYSVFSPRTGKVRNSGKVVLSQTSTGREGSSVVRACYPGVRGDDYLLLQASLEVAARIINSLNIPVPPVCP